MELDVNNFETWSVDEYVENLKRLDAPTYKSLIGEVVYYAQKSYGQHKIIEWCPKKGAFLLDIEGQRFWTNPFRIFK